MKTKATVFNILSSYTHLIFSIVSGLILVPFYLKDFGSEVYGVWLATGNLLSWFSIFGGSISLVHAQKLAVSHAEGDSESFRKFVGSGLVLYTALACLIVFGVWITADWFLGLFAFDQSQYEIIKMALGISTVSAAISVFYSPLVHILGSWMTNGPVLKATVAGGATGIILNILLLYHGFGLLSIPAAMLGKSLVMLAMILPGVIKEWAKKGLSKPILDWRNAQKLGKESSPILISNLASIGLNHSQATLIGFFFGPGAATVISITDKIFSLVKSLILPVGNALLQPLSSILHIPQQFNTISTQFLKHMEILSLFSILTCLLINPTFISLWVGQSYYGGHLVSAALAFSAFSMIQINQKVSVANAKGEFRATSRYAILDLVLRMSILLVAVYVIHVHHIVILPIAEFTGIFLAGYIIFSKQFETNGTKQLAITILFLLLLGIGSLGLYHTTSRTIIDVLFTVVLVFAILFLFKRIIEEKLLAQVFTSFQSIRRVNVEE